MGFSWTVFWIGLTLGILQLAIGIVVGRLLWIGRRWRLSAPMATPAKSDREEPEPLDVEQLRSVAGRLQRLMTNVAGDVGRHQVRIEQLTKDLSSLRHESRAGMTEFVLGRVAEIVEVNRTLQVRLAKVEHKLQIQAEEIKLHASEAKTDSLTGLPNRRAFDRQLENHLDRWRQRQEGFCLVMIDTDDFKALNDRHGHLAGDELLRVVAETLDGEMSACDMAARIGGDEFALILREDCLERATPRCAGVLRAVTRSRFHLGSAAARVSTSMGLAVIGPDENETDLIARADKALYAAKKAGKGCAYYHDGRQCVPIGSAAANAPADAWQTRTASLGSPDDTEEVARDLVDLCDSVRTRLDEVLSPALDPDAAPSDRSCG